MQKRNLTTPKGSFVFHSALLRISLFSLKEILYAELTEPKAVKTFKSGKFNSVGEIRLAESNYLY